MPFMHSLDKLSRHSVPGTCLRERGLWWSWYSPLHSRKGGQKALFYSLSPRSLIIMPKSQKPWRLEVLGKFGIDSLNDKICPELAQGCWWSSSTPFSGTRIQFGAEIRLCALGVPGPFRHWVRTCSFPSPVHESPHKRDGFSENFPCALNNFTFYK